jgi:hypothetical protein
MIYRPRGEQANHYTADVVIYHFVYSKQVDVFKSVYYEHCVQMIPFGRTHTTQLRAVVGRDHMVIRFTTKYAISAYHH